MQINRLFEIVYILLDKKIITARTLAEHFEVSKRTIYRDLEILSQAGIPIYTSKGKGGGIRILPEFVLNKSILSDTEQNEILSALQSQNALNGKQGDPVLNKMALLFKKDNTNWIDVDFSHWGSDEKERQKFSLIKNSILGKTVLSFDYYNSCGEKSTRIIEPLKLLFKSQSWYLQGYCRLKGSYRIFKITRIQNITSVNEVFEREAPGDIWNEGDYTATMVDLVLRFDGEMAYRLYDEFPAEAINNNGDGSYTVTTKMPQGEWLYGYVMSFGEYVEILEPSALKAEIKKKYQKVLQKYL
ncbi:helix-turn-helix transcriptional regulator [Acetobacterium woodii]|uniref:Transcriptional regulator DeoR family n=1 Tax=Acetobacterium woodii (strain ATCC 29683 / DSM 1030 / JCM 2381 / KCTC 1655 / WB1) TaxID=931626 RepID=H6LHP7_ACEWD|nr:YafY family protein [Acetobacterium woodii]AFA47226.1 transcriptional regulator DeoR family [Acetobacterium woodii DSM 1030]